MLGWLCEEKEEAKGGGRDGRNEGGSRRLFLSARAEDIVILASV